jgi:hypothetical protein
VQLLPLLRAAGMTYRDLEVRGTGPALDGRPVRPPTHAHGASLAASIADSSSGLVLAFGVGVPGGSAHDLKWNSKVI